MGLRVSAMSGHIRPRLITTKNPGNYLSVLIDVVQIGPATFMLGHIVVERVCFIKVRAATNTDPKQIFIAHPFNGHGLVRPDAQDMALRSDPSGLEIIVDGGQHRNPGHRQAADGLG